MSLPAFPGADFLELQMRSKKPIPNELCPEKPKEALKAGRVMWESQFPDLRFRSISNTYNCVGMVLASRRAWVYPKDLMQILLDEGFRQLHTISDLCFGDIVVYENPPEAEPTHVGLFLHTQPITSEGDDPFWVLSKWGGFGEYAHLSRYVPSVYGRPTQFWTHRRDP